MTHKRLLSMALSCMLILVCLFVFTVEADAAVVEQGACGELTWSYDDSGRLSISGTGAMPDYTSDITLLPWYNYMDSITTIEIKSGVTTIGSYAFAGCTKATTLEIYGQITTIGEGAFMLCTSLKSVSVPATVTTIGKGAFAYCESMTTCTYKVSAYLTTIEESAFAYCTALTRVKLPTSTKTIGAGAYMGCESLRELYIQTGVTSVGQSAFDSCTSLGSVSFPSTLVTLGEGAFANCTKLSSVVYSSTGKLEAISDGAFSGCLALTKVSFPASIKTVGALAYANCTALKTLTIPQGVTTIGDGAFANCDGLTTVAIPASVTEIGIYPFYMCDSLTKITVKSGNTALVADSYGCLYDIDKTVLIQAPTALSGSYTIPSTVVAVGPGAFANCDKLTAVTIPEGLLYIGDECFYDCDGLTQLVLADTVALVGPAAFAECDNLASVDLGESLLSIEAELFHNCKALTQIVIPEPVSMVGTEAFGFCSALKRIVFKGNAPEMTIDCFRGVTAEVIYFSLKEGWTDSVKSDHSGVITWMGIESAEVFGRGSCGENATWYLPVSGVLTISGYGRTSNWSSSTYVPWAPYRKYIKEVVISPDITTIGDFMFSGMGQIDTFDIPQNLTYIGICAFSGTAITEFHMPQTVTKIGRGVFSGCTQLKDVTLSDNLTELQDSMFSKCSSLVTVELPSKLQTTGYEIFRDCTSLTHVTIPLSVTQIGRGAFWGCTALQWVRFECSSPVMPSNTFNKATATVYYPGNDPTWDDKVGTNMGGTLTWVAYDRTGVRSSDGTYYDTFAQALSSYKGAPDYLTLVADATVDVTLSCDLYVDLNGYDLSGTVRTGGYKVYGMDSTTYEYTCDRIGYWSCTDEAAAPVVPQKYFISDITGKTQWNLTTNDENGYSFHQFHLAVTHMTVKPAADGVGFKATFYGDPMVVAALDQENGIGMTLWLKDGSPVSVEKSPEGLTSGKKISLRVEQYDVENYGEVPLYAKAHLRLADGTVIESATASMSLRTLFERLQDQVGIGYYAKLAIKEMIARHPIINEWDIGEYKQQAGTDVPIM